MSDVVSGPLRVPGDLLVHVESLEYCTKTVKIRNPSAEEITLSDVVGLPLVAGTNGADYNLMVAGGEANVLALLVDGPAGQDSEVIPATTNGVGQYQALVHPPAILNQDKFRVLDAVGGTINQANLQTRLKALLYELRAEPTKYSQL